MERLSLDSQMRRAGFAGATFPGSPRLLKAAIIGLDPLNPLASVVVFQYNGLSTGQSKEE